MMGWLTSSGGGIGIGLREGRFSDDLFGLISAAGAIIKPDGPENNEQKRRQTATIWPE